MLELWGMRGVSSLPLLPGPLCPGVVVPDRALTAYLCYTEFLELDLFD